MSEESGAGFALWFTGLPGSGKSSVSRAVCDALEEAGYGVAYLSMDARRRVYTPVPEYTPEERDRAYDLFVYEAARLVARGIGVVMDATGHRLVWRKLARSRITRFAEIHLDCDLDTAMTREAARPQGKVMAGLYAKALTRRRTGQEIPGLGEVIGVDTAFETDPAAELRIDARLSLEAILDEALSFLAGWLHEPALHPDRSA